MTYNTDINIIGSIPDYHLIYTALPLLVKRKEELQKILVTDNEYNLRTEKSRKRFLAVLNTAFISSNQSVNNIAVQAIVYLKNDETAQALILFWLFSINNQLFYELNRDVYLKSLFQGRAELPKGDVLAYLKDLVSRNPELKDKWSESTLDIIASKYLTTLKKLNLLEGSHKKSFRFVRMSDELYALFLHLYTQLERPSSNALEDEFMKFSFIAPESLVDRLKKIGKKGWINMSYTGASLSIESAFQENDIIDGIFGRTQG
jgi:hypothetical protein